ncbi:MotA/TolQ/ExbB proton channel family protein [Xylophilus sp. GW821-FHT01B05]
MNFNFIHDIVLWAMAVLLTAAVAVIIERGIYFNYVERSRKRLLGLLSKGDTVALDKELQENEAPHARMLNGVRLIKGASSENIEMKVQALYLKQQPLLRRMLWLVDTTITLSPLLGLLGTILGIIDTFTALAAAGTSDPQAVSRGIGTALIATGAGIGIAVIGLVFNNWFNERVERINEQLKVIALENADSGKA